MNDGKALPHVGHLSERQPWSTGDMDGFSFFPSYSTGASGGSKERDMRLLCVTQLAGESLSNTVMARMQLRGRAFAWPM